MVYSLILFLVAICYFVYKVGDAMNKTILLLVCFVFFIGNNVIYADEITLKSIEVDDVDKIIDLTNGKQKDTFTFELMKM